MARILFVVFNQTRYGYIGSFPTIATIVSVVKNRGHEVEVSVVRPSWSSAKKLTQQVLRFRPNLVGFSTMTTDYSTALTLARTLKKSCNVMTLFGGVHVTLNPEDVIREPAIDFICLGEGEYPTLELLEAIDRGGDPSTIQNIWAKRDGVVIRNPLRRLNDLEELPHPNTDLFYHREKPIIYRTMTSVGCPHNCSYCINHLLRQTYSGLGQHLRRKSVARVIGELEEVKRNYHIREISFLDDTFVLDKKWTLEFCEQYRERIALPFTIPTTITSIDAEIAQNLKRASCKRIWLGIETGNEQLRQQVLQKRVSNAEIERATRLLQDVGIICVGLVMIGIPGEREEHLIETYDFIKKLDLDQVRVSMAVPFKGTRLWQISQESGLRATEGTPRTFHTPSTTLNFPRQHRRLLRRYFHKIWNLNNGNKYQVLRDHPRLVPFYRAAKLVLNDCYLETVYQHLREIGNWR
jgi:anaerobic magnesium-protoporphyrin IX monomethyl ester cyclase